MFYGWKISLLSMGGNFMLQGSVALLHERFYGAPVRRLWLDAR